MKPVNINPFFRRRIEAIYNKVHKEQIADFSVGDKVIVVRRRHIRFSFADSLSTKTRLEEILIAFLYSGHIGIITKISRRDSNGIVEYYHFQREMKEEDIEKDIRSIGTIEITVGLAVNKGTILADKDVTVTMLPKEINRVT